MVIPLQLLGSLLWPFLNRGTMKPFEQLLGKLPVVKTALNSLLKLFRRQHWPYFNISFKTESKPPALLFFNELIALEIS